MCAGPSVRRLAHAGADMPAKVRIDEEWAEEEKAVLIQVVPDLAGGSSLWVQRGHMSIKK